MKTTTPSLLLLAVTGSLAFPGCKFPELPPVAEDGPDAVTQDAAATDAAADAPIDSQAIDTPPGTYALLIERNGFGSGSVTGTVPPSTTVISCGAGGGCSTVVVDGTMVTLTATPSAGDLFFGWSGGGCTGTAPCTTTVNAATTVTATFDQCDRTMGEVCNDASNQYEQCSSSGQSTMTMTCPLYCSSAVEKCVDISPSDDPNTNPLDAQMDLLAGSGQNLVFPSSCTPGGCTINTTTGAIAGATSGGAAPTAIVGGVRVYRVQSLSLAGTVKVSGSYPVAFLSNGPITVTGVLDASADGGNNGPGAQAEGASCTGRIHRSSTATAAGAGGGGRSTFGGNGGNGASGQVGADGGNIQSEPTLIPLIGGCSGGWSDESGGAAVSIARGAGGGAVQMVSRATISFQSGAVIDVSGGGGISGDFFTTTVSVGGAGGGSGGSILLEAPTITLDGAGVVLSAKGGSGAAGTRGLSGADGGYGAAPAPGGVNSNGADGGAGGTESAAAQPGQAAQGGSTDGAGGGGSVGLCRLNTRTGAIVQQNGAAIRCSRPANTTFTERLIP